MRIDNKMDIMSHINANSIVDDEITIVNKDNKKIMTLKEVIAIFITERDNWETFNFETFNSEDGSCSIETKLIDSYDTEKQELKLTI